MEEKTENTIENTQIDIEKEPPYKKYPRFKDWIFRLVLFGVGLIGLELITLVIELIVMAVNPSYLDEKSDLYLTGLTIVNSVRYAVLAVMFVILLFPRLRVILAKFKNWKHDLIGLAGGVALILLSMLYNFIISQFVDIGANNNEEAAESMITMFPVISIFILGMIGPICEEITYRYGLFGCLKKKNIILAYIVTTIVFAFIHFDFTGDLVTELLNIPTYLIAGFGLTFIYHKWGFNASIIAHVFNNMYVIVLTIIGL